MQAEDVHEAPGAHALQRRARLGVEVHVFAQAHRVIHINRLGRHVEVAHPQERLLGRVVTLEEGTQPRQPLQFVAEVLRIGLTALGYVGVDDRDAPYLGPQQAGLVGRPAIVQPEGHSRWRCAAQERHAAVGLLPPEGQVIAGLSQGLRREVGILHFRLLQAQHIRSLARQPVQHQPQPRADRVNVEGCYLHVRVRTNRSILSLARARTHFGPGNQSRIAPVGY